MYTYLSGPYPPQLTGLPPTHPSPTPIDAVHSITPSAKYFTSADALYRYWQMNLVEEDRHFTTVITPYGHFQHYRGLVGFTATGDAV